MVVLSAPLVIGDRVDRRYRRLGPEALVEDPAVARASSRWPTPEPQS